LAKFQSPRAITWPKIIGLERNVNLICNSSLYTHIPKFKSDQVYISFRSNDFWPSYDPWTLKFGQIFSCDHFFSLCFEILTWYLICGCIMISCRSSLRFVPIQWFLAELSSRVITRPKIIGPERNVNLIWYWYSGIMDMGNTICPSHLVAGT
jgi:hypothetical protein